MSNPDCRWQGGRCGCTKAQAQRCELPAVDPYKQFCTLRDKFTPAGAPQYSEREAFDLVLAAARNVTSN